MSHLYETDYPRAYAPQPGMNPWLVRLPILFVGGALLFVMVLVALVVALQVHFNDRMLPGVSVRGVALSGLTRSEAAAALQGAFTYGDQAVFTFRYGDGDRFWQFSAGELGITFDVDGTAAEAFAAGHSENILSDVVAQASIWLNGRSIAPIVRYDQNVAAAKLGEIAAAFNRPAVDATLDISGTVVSTQPSQTGLTLDIPAILSALEQAMLQLNTGAEIPLTIHESQPRIRDASAAAAKIQAALSGPLTLVTDDQQGGTLGPWTASVDQIRGLLALTLVDNGDGTQSYDVAINPEPFRAFVSSLASGLIALPSNGRFHFNESTRLLEPIKDSTNGRELDVDGTLTRIEEAVSNPVNRIVPLAFTYTLPDYSANVSASELGITQLVAEATSYYTGSTQSRVTNIIEALERFNGLIIAPGEEFSFNHYLGDINVEDGFVQGKIIFGGRTVEGVGGGVCQVSTTIFRAALKAGFPIVERNSHGYRVGFYELNNTPPGLDAAIFQPTADFRFVNDTPYYLLFETSVFPQDQSIQFRLYSTNPGRQVVIEGPVINAVVPPKPTVYQANAQLQPGQELYVDWAKEGADVLFTRRILDAGGQEIRSDSIYTHYLPWAAVIEVNPQDPRVVNQQTG